MLIGRVSKLTGASRKAIRHYESIGLIDPPARKGNYRVYSDHDVIVIHMICRAKNLGFSLSEIKELVSKKTKDKKLPIDLAYQLIDQKISNLKQETERIQHIIGSLQEFKMDLGEKFT
ncbi:MerR family transcriptional regulator [Agaribacterium sp. ZY112]|uniref:MerR family transcriptional regulator n=1 Tax=Agaribacterium sp. ZY112 TaxID=3233574 RepID=UPI003526A947